MGRCIYLNKIWAKNRKVIDATAKRFFAVSSENVYHLIVDDFSSEEIEVPFHQSNPSLGTHYLQRNSDIFIEFDDGKSLAEEEKITLIKWGNCIVRKVDHESRVANITLRTEDVDFKGTKKMHWVPNSNGVYI